MVKRAFLIFSFACLATGVAWAVDDPMVGNWKLNSQKSTIFDEMKVTSLGSNQYAFDFGGGHPESIVADGTDQPGLGGTTLAVTEVGSDEWKVVRKKDARVELIGIWTLSQDGSTLRDDYSEFDGAGKVTTHVIYLYARKGGGPGFASDWVSTSQQMDTPYVVQVRPYEADGLSIVHPSEGVTDNVKFDGKDYPSPGSRADALTSAQRVNERTIEMTFKVGGKVVATQEVGVSEDGKTLTMTVHSTGRSEPNVLVFERE
jgi:hypothetical protein